MKNLTVSIGDEVYRRARKTAADKDTSVSRMVADYLSKLAHEEDTLGQARKKMDALFKTVTHFRQGEKIPRAQLHAR